MSGIELVPRVLLERLLPALLHAVAACGHDADMRFSCLKVMSDLLTLLLDLNADGEPPAFNHAQPALGCTIEMSARGLYSDHAFSASYRRRCLNGNPFLQVLQVFTHHFARTAAHCCRRHMRH